MKEAQTEILQPPRNAEFMMKYTKKQLSIARTMFNGFATCKWAPPGKRTKAEQACADP